MGTVLASTICHYCGPRGRRATTQDHIVPRAILPRPLSVLPYWFREHFVVPSCSPCNNVKRADRSDCVCEQCTWVWQTALSLWLPPGYTPRVVKVEAMSRARRLLTA